MRETVSSLPHLMYEDLAVAAPVIGWCAGAAIAFGFVWLLLLRLLAGYMVWATLAAAAVGMGAAAWWLWTTQESMKGSPLYGADDLHTQQADACYYAFIGVSALAGIYLLLLLCLRRKIVVAVRILQEATKAVARLPLLLVMPLVAVAISLAIIAYGCTVAVLLASSGELLRTEQGFGRVSLDDATRGWLGLHAFGVAWSVFWVRHVQHCVVAGAVSHWYFAADKRHDMSAFPVVGALCKTLRYHAGSVALGSFLITLLKAIRWAFRILQKKMKKWCATFRRSAPAHRSASGAGATPPHSPAHPSALPPPGASAAASWRSCAAAASSAASAASRSPSSSSRATPTSR